ncbi:MAG: sulfotransferase family 2 domain-containing protein [Anaerolineae bacterium]|nr:sulfotransferase family 2 domain-containing protein [Anaerolineae bacterium]
MNTYKKYFATIKAKITKRIRRPQPKQSVHFLHIGKTGGTAVVYALNQYNYCVISPRRARLNLPNLYKLNPPVEDSHLTIYVHPHNESLRDVPPGEKVFFFLRDPISRFVSGFYSRQSQGQPTYNSPWRPDEKIAFEHFSSANQLAVALSSTNKNEKAMAEKAMSAIYHIKSSYWEWFESEEYLKSRLADIFFVGFQENLAQDFEILKSKLHLPDCVYLPTDAVLAFKNRSPLDKTLEQTAIANLKLWYQDDYRFIDLCKEIFDFRVLPIR